MSRPNITGRTPGKFISILGITLFINFFLFSLVKIFREEGPAALYKGFVPKVLRLAPGGGVLLLVVEFTLGVFRKGKPPLHNISLNKN